MPSAWRTARTGPAISRTACRQPATAPRGCGTSSRSGSGSRRTLQAAAWTRRRPKERLKKIEDAVGRPVTKAILDLQDAVVLDVGDLVTHAAVQRAHDAGSLDSLLDSVYRAEVQFDKDELRARRPGEATLDQAAGTGAPVVEEMRATVQQAAADRGTAAARSKAADDAARRDATRRATDGHGTRGSRGSPHGRAGRHRWRRRPVERRGTARGTRCRGAGDPHEGRRPGQARRRQALGTTGRGSRTRRPGRPARAHAGRRVTSDEAPRRFASW